MDIDQYNERNRKRSDTMRSIKDYGMGVVIACMGCVILYLHKSGKYDFSKFPGDDMIYPLCGLFVVYGLFRCYRGYKKNY
jgi:hypothetical protein